MNNLPGITLMIGAMAMFTLADTSIKTLSWELPRGEILALVGLSGLFFFGWMVVRSGERLFDRSFYSRLMLVRNTGEVIGTLGIFTALTLIPISTVSAIMQTAPLFATIGAALFLGEAVGWRRWVAISVGFAGALMIIRPGGVAFDPAMLIALGGVMFQVVRDVATRPASQRSSSARIGFYGVVWLVVLSLVLMIFDQTPPRLPSAGMMPYVLGLMVVGNVGYHMLNTSIRMADISVVLPFRYSRILFGILAGMLIFAERPDFWTLAGSGIIVGSGLFVLWRERVRRLRAA